MVTIQVSVPDAIEFCILALRNGDKQKALDILEQISQKSQFSFYQDSWLKYIKNDKFLIKKSYDKFPKIW